MDAITQASSKSKGKIMDQKEELRECVRMIFQVGELNEVPIAILCSGCLEAAALILKKAGASDAELLKLAKAANGVVDSVAASQKNSNEGQS